MYSEDSKIFLVGAPRTQGIPENVDFQKSAGKGQVCISEEIWRTKIFGGCCTWVTKNWKDFSSAIM